MAGEDPGDSVKYIQVTNKDKNGKTKKPVIEINLAKIDEGLKYAGYNLSKVIVTTPGTEDKKEI